MYVVKVGCSMGERNITEVINFDSWKLLSFMNRIFHNYQLSHECQSDDFNLSTRSLIVQLNWQQQPVISIFLIRCTGPEVPFRLRNIYTPDIGFVAAGIFLQMHERKFTTTTKQEAFQVILFRRNIKIGGVTWLSMRQPPTN